MRRAKSNEEEPEDRASRANRLPLKTNSANHNAVQATGLNIVKEMKPHFGRAEKKNENWPRIPESCYCCKRAERQERCQPISSRRMPSGRDDQQNREDGG
jgi:hypothetical protein